MHKTLTERGYHMTDAEFRAKQGELLLQEHEARKAAKLEDTLAAVRKMDGYDRMNVAAEMSKL